MSTVSLPRAAPRAHACFLGLAACAWMAATSAQAAEAAAPEQVEAPFTQYRGWRDEPLEDWRQANERVGDIGGWRTYLRESQQAGDGADGQPVHHGHD